ncbi:hypothetical protein Tsubulata_012894 [Turnera subulata]|uniref:F-box domain-containing protein n=1 Tax=Turnera subulata TaxID=218843 RepID=A0A9Q0F1Y3_9ROSI|nr:hypothetical protein Tsubulata_012894 [Turnera subulata]
MESISCDGVKIEFQNPKPRSLKAMEQTSTENNHRYDLLPDDRYDLLPDDALTLVFSRTSFADHIRLRLVCKGWKRLLEDEDIEHEGRLPWKMFFDFRPAAAGLVQSSCKLYDPSNRQTYTVEDGIKSVEDRGKFQNAAILESKHGWVLFRVQKPKREHTVQHLKKKIVYSLLYVLHS